MKNTNTGKVNIRKQEDILLEYLRKHSGVTRATGLSKCRIANTPEIIRRLKENGHKIGDEWMTRTNQYGEKVRYKRYFLIEGAKK